MFCTKGLTFFMNVQSAITKAGITFIFFEVPIFVSVCVFSLDLYSNIT